MDNDYPPCFFGELPQERRYGVAEMVGGAERREEMRRELVLSKRVWSVERRDDEVMKVDVRDRIGIPALDSELSLVVVDGGADEVDGDVVGGDDAGEVEELVDVALCR